MANKDYRYDVCGLDNVILVDLPILVDDDGDEVVQIQGINMLHRLLLKAVVSKKGGLNAKEIRFIRSEIGLTQAQLGDSIRKDGQTVGRWERGENNIEEDSDMLIRVLAIQSIEGSEAIPDLLELAKLSIPVTEQKPYLIDASDPSNYKLVA